jgi:tetratricopeptide (TPR) repeat protein
MGTDSVSEYFNAGMEHLKDDNIDKALRAFEKAYRGDKSNASYMSYYGMCKALRGGQIGLGLEMCTMAIKKEFYRSEFYLNLGKVYLAAGNRKVAIKVLKKGLRFEPRNQEIHKHLAVLGCRDRPVIESLERSNPINKFLGVFLRKKKRNFSNKS